MYDTKLLQAILDGQVVIRKDINEVKNEVKSTKDVLAKRIEKLGLQIADLEDGAPTIGEFDDLEKRVSKIEDLVIKN